MNEKNSDWTNELMDEEDNMIEKMHRDYCKRLEKKLQNKVDKMEQEMPEVTRLKKKTCRSQTDNNNR